MSTLRPPTRLNAAFAAIAIAVAVLAPATTAAASAPSRPEAVPAAPADAGWLRLGHFSPDTKAVDVRVSALRGGSVLLELSDVGYGDISPYQQLPAGAYAVSMIAAGTDDWTKLAISDTVTVRPVTATTVAAYGPNTSLRVRAFTDDLASPVAGGARIRVIQASTTSTAVDVETSTGASIVRAARAGSASGYVEIPAGATTLRMTARGVADEVDVDIQAGTVTTRFVLDTADGKLTIIPVLDSAAPAAVPREGVQTGGGGMATKDRTATPRGGVLPI